MQAQSSKASHEVWNWSKNSIVLTYQLSVHIFTRRSKKFWMSQETSEFLNLIRNEVTYLTH